MTEYGSPTFYLGEIGTEAWPMKGQMASTAGFVGVAQKGTVGGPPRLVASFADFKRMYGGHLPEGEFGQFRFLAYAVEHFFLNGGLRCYVMRTAPQDANPASGTVALGGGRAMRLIARDPGVWGNSLKVAIWPCSKAKTRICGVIEGEEDKKYYVGDGAGFLPGDLVFLQQGGIAAYDKVIRCLDNTIVFERGFREGMADPEVRPGTEICTCEFAMEVWYEDVMESYECLSLNQSGPCFVGTRTARSELIRVELLEERGGLALPPYGWMEDGMTVRLTGGSNGEVRSMAASDFIGVDGGAGRRTGIQAFLDNHEVSALACPGVTDPFVQLALAAHCENISSRFAVLDMPQEAAGTDGILSHRHIIESSRAALYHPWLTVFDPLVRKRSSIPPSGAVMGAYARGNDSLGPRQTALDSDVPIRSCLGTDIRFGREEQDVLSSNGINLIQAFPGRGIRLCGDKMACSADGCPSVKELRQLISIEKCAKPGTR